MNPRVKDVKPNPDYTLIIAFMNGEVKFFDVKPYLNIGVFRELQDKGLFNSVKPFLGSIQWKNGQDFCPDTLYLESVAVGDVGISPNIEHRAEHVDADMIAA